MLTSKFVLESPNLWCEKLNESLPSTLISRGLKVDQELGSGGVQHLQMQDGLWVNQINLKLIQPIELIRAPKEINDYFIINFHLSKSKIEQSGDGKSYKLGLENINILLASSTTSAKIIVPPNVPVKIFNIGFSSKWLKENILSSDGQLNHLFPDDHPIYLSEVIDYKFKQVLKNIDLEKNNRLKLFSNTLQLLDYFFTRLKNRKNLPDQFMDIHPDDLGRLMLVKENIDNNANNTISLDNLSKLAGMSLSKFKRLFKQVFGTTPYQYYLENKMEAAMELLLTKKYSCSEVGYIIGYSNLSQFSRAFKKHFNALPKDVK